MIEHAPSTRPSRRSRRPSRGDRHRRVAQAARIRRGLDHRRAGYASRSVTSAARQRRAWLRVPRRHRHRPLDRPGRAGARIERCLAACPAVRIAAARRVRDLGGGRGPAACGTGVGRGAGPGERTPSRPACLAAYMAASASERIESKLGRAGAEHRDADAGGDLRNAFLRGHVLADRGGDRLGDRPRLLASQRGRTIANSSPPSRARTSVSRVPPPAAPRRSLDHPVADRVAERVVDRLEVVEVEHQQGAGRSLAAAARQLAAAGLPRSAAGS